MHICPICSDLGYPSNQLTDRMKQTGTMKNSKALPLHPHELEFAAWFLEDAGADFEDHSDDETFLPATDDSLAIAAAIRAVFGDEAPEAGICHVPGGDANLVQFYTSQAMTFFSQRCRELAGSAEPQNLNPTELALMAKLLELAGDDHEKIAEDVCFDLTLDVTSENRGMFTAAVDNYLARHQTTRAANDRNVAETAIAVRASVLSDEPMPTVDIPDYWLMFYLAQRCKDLPKAG